MKIKAAVLYDYNTPLKVEEIELDEPKVGEVRVKIEATGFCHTDLHYITGDMFGPMPMVLGHEGAGIVDAVGPGVTSLKPGDNVVMGVCSPCGRCPQCGAGLPYKCEIGPERRRTGGLPTDGTGRMHKNGEPLYYCFGQSSFAEYVVVNEMGVAKINNDAPFDKVCALGCGIGTGLGAVLNNPRIKVDPGDSVAVFGCGTVGLSVIMGAKLLNVSHIVAIDLLDNKLEVAKEVGATLTINASRRDPVERTVLDIGPVDYAFECVGKPALVNQAFDITKPLGGAALILGAMPMGQTVTFEGFTFLLGRSVIGVGGGFMRPLYDIPRYVDLYMKGQLPLDKLITHHVKLDDINKAVEMLQKGESIKTVVHP